MFRVFSRFPEQMPDATYDFAEMATQKLNEIVKRMSTLESTFGRSGGMLEEVLGTSLRGLE
jgi:hypothetical protein